MKNKERTMKKYIFLTILSIFLLKQFSFATYDDLRIDHFTSARKDVVIEGTDGQYVIKKSINSSDEIQGLYLRTCVHEKRCVKIAQKKQEAYELPK